MYTDIGTLETDTRVEHLRITEPSLGKFRQGLAMTRKRGRCVLVGLPGEFLVSALDVVANGITIRGSFIGVRADMVEALGFGAECRIKADIEFQPLSSQPSFRTARPWRRAVPRGPRIHAHRSHLNPTGRSS